MLREQSILHIRPNIAFEQIHSNPEQLFQDKTLRPILKLQHELILALFKEYLESHKIDFNHLTAAQRNAKIDQTLKQNQALQALLKGVIIALFINEEIAFWKNNKIAVNKRIQQLLIKRIQSSFIEKEH
jgi:hypothetical protein